MFPPMDPITVLTKAFPSMLSEAEGGKVNLKKVQEVMTLLDLMTLTKVERSSTGHGKGM